MHAVATQDTMFSFSIEHSVQWDKVETQQMSSTNKDLSGIGPVIVTVFLASSKHAFQTGLVGLFSFGKLTCYTLSQLVSSIH